MELQAGWIAGRWFRPAVLAWALLVAQVAAPGQAPIEEGVRLFRAGDYGAAARVFQEVAEGETRSRARAAAFRWMGMSLAAMNDFAAAEPAFGEACRLDAGTVENCYYHARTLFTNSRFEEAVVSYKKAASGPQAWRAMQGMGLALEAMGRGGEAERALRQAAKDSKGKARADTDPRVDLGAFLFRQGRPGEAVGVLEECAAAYPDSARVMFESARALAAIGRDEEAAGRLRKAVTLEPSHGPAHLLLGKVCRRLGLDDEARRHEALAAELVR